MKGRRTSSASEWLDGLLDAGSFRAWDESVAARDHLGFVDSEPYVERLASARGATGRNSSVLTGSGVVDGHPVAVIVVDFLFLGGTIGTAEGERVARAFERAASGGLPLIALVTSGGTRMQEGTRGFLEMSKALIALRAFLATGLPYVCYLGDPAVGGVVASWGSLAHFLFAAPGATIGFAGPRAARALTLNDWPEDVQVSERLLEHGLLDGVFPPNQIRERILEILDVVSPRAAPVEVGQARVGAQSLGQSDPWDSVVRSRNRGRPGAVQLLEVLAERMVSIGGSRTGLESDPGCLAYLAELGGRGVVVVAQDRSTGHNGGMTVEGYRKATRALRTANELRLPIVTVVDTAGAVLDPAPGCQGLAWELAACQYELLTVRSPTVSVLLGQGGGGGALALLPADRVLAAEHAWLAPIAPEGASSIVYRAPDEAPQMARSQGITVRDLKSLGFVDSIVAEPSGSARSWHEVLRDLARQVSYALTELSGMSSHRRLAERRERYRNLGG